MEKTGRVDNIFKAIVAISIALAFVMPGAAVIANLEKNQELIIYRLNNDDWIMELEHKEGVAGETGILVHLNGTWNESLSGIQSFVFYDTSQLEYWKGDFTGTIMEPMNTKFADPDPDYTGLVNVGMVVFFEPNPPAGSGMIAKLIFNITSSATNGVTPLTFGVHPGTGQENLYFNPASAGFAPLLYNGSITISGGNNRPNEPSNPSPSDSATDVSIDADISWTGGDPDADPVDYDVYFDTVNPPTTLVSENQTATFYDPGTLDYETTYYWQIIADDGLATTSGPIWSFTTEPVPNVPPYTPTDPNPVDSAIDVAIDTDLSWTGGDPDVGDTVTYDVYFDVVSPPTYVATVGAENYDPGTLAYETTYFWQIESEDSFGETATGPIWSFTTEPVPNAPPFTPSSPSPVDSATDVDLDEDLSWTGGDPDGDPVTYDVYFDVISPPQKVQSNQTDTTYALATLDYDTIYYWKIISWDDQGATTAGPIWSFTTRANQMPYEPSNPNPANSATGVERDTALSWAGGDPDIGQTVTYEVYFDVVSPPTYVDTVSVETYDPGFLDYETTFFWQIISYDDQGGSTPGPIWEFTTEVNQPPYVPSSPIPSDGAIGMPLTQDVSWTGEDPGGDTVTYDVYFDVLSTPQKVSDNQSTTTYDPGILAYNTTYFWQIIAWDEYGLSTSGPIWNFTTASGEELSFVWVDDDFDDTLPGFGYMYFDVIQDGIDAVAEHGTVYVYNGFYYENVLVNKTVDLIGESKEGVIVDAESDGDVFAITVDWVNMSGFTFRTSAKSLGWDDAGVDIRTNYNTIEDCNIINNNYGVYLENAHFNTIILNTISSNNDGVHSVDSTYNYFSENTISENENGLYLVTSYYNTINDNEIVNNYYNGIYLDQSTNNDLLINTVSANLDGIRGMQASDNTISGNTIDSNIYNGIFLQSSSDNNDLLSNIVTNNDDGIELRDSTNNYVFDNDIGFNDDGIELGGAPANTIEENNIHDNTGYGIYIRSSSTTNQIFHNNFAANGGNAYDETTNVWDDDYPSGGNHWDDYGGVDNFRGPDQDIPNPDGIGDTPYDIPGPSSSQDKYPLMYPWGENPPIAEFTYVIDDVTVTFDGSPSYDRDGTIVSYFWEFDDGENSTETSPIYTYASYGVYDVTLTVTDDDGYIGTITYTIVIDDFILPEIVDNTLDVAYTGDPFTFTADVTDLGGIVAVQVEYWYGTQPSTTLPMSNISGDTWEAEITVDHTLLSMYYIISANDTADNLNDTGVQEVTIYDNDPPTITGITGDTTGTTGDPVTITATNDDNIQIDTELLFYKQASDPTWSTTPFTDGAGSIPIALTSIEDVYYYVWVNDTSNNILTDPATAPADFYTITVTDNDAPEITSITGDTTGTTGETTTITASFTDNIDVTEATLYYKLASAGTYNSKTILTGTAEVDIPLDTIETWHYYITIDDAAGNGPIGNPSTDGTTYYTITVTDNDAPEITNIMATPEHLTEPGDINITCDVTDNINVAEVRVIIEGPAGFTPVDATMNPLAADSFFYNESYTHGGTYTYHIWAIDDQGNTVISENYTFSLRECGDVNADGELNVGDAVFLINYIFNSGPAPDPVCAGDANGDNEVNVGDAVYLINFIFKFGPPPVTDCCPFT